MRQVNIAIAESCAGWFWLVNPLFFFITFDPDRKLHIYRLILMKSTGNRLKRLFLLVLYSG